jgi:hypothetical protein
MNKFLAVLFILFISSSSSGQKTPFQYRRDLGKLSPGWKLLILPQDIFHKLSDNKSDIRIVGTDEIGDTLEAAYLREVLSEKSERKQIDFDIINRSTRPHEWIYTFQTRSSQTLNEIETEFRTGNFDGKAKLEGSLDQKEWFTILENYRLLSIQTPETSYRFGRLIFPVSDYAFYRLRILCDVDPDLTTAYLWQTIQTPAVSYSTPPFKLVEKTDRNSKETIVRVQFDYPVPVSSIDLKTGNSLDYFREMSIRAAKDSVKTRNGMQINYHPVWEGTLSSLEKKPILFETQLVKWLEIIVRNEDNEPIHFNNIIPTCNQEILKIRISKEGNYSLLYGKKGANEPHYDLAYLPVPSIDSITLLEVGQELSLVKKAIETEQTKLKTFWLWGIIALTIALMVWFSVRMARN